MDAMANHAFCCASLWLSLLVRHLDGKQQPQHRYMKKDTTSVTTKIMIILVDNATILSLSVSEAEVRILSFTWGVDCPLHILVFAAVLLHYTAAHCVTLRVPAFTLY